MKVKAIIAIALIISAVLMAAKVSPADNGEQFREGRYIHVDSMEIQFKNSDATVSMKYHLSPFAQSYIFLFGSKNLEPKIEEIFSKFQEVKIVKIGRSSATLQIKNISRKSDEYYLHESKTLGVQTDVLTIVFPDGTKIDKEHTKETPNTFY
jgi:hypothetical protein